MEKETSKKTHKKAKKEEKVKNVLFSHFFINKVVSKNLILELTFEE